MKPWVRVRGVAAVTATVMALSPYAAPQIYASSAQPGVQSVGSSHRLTTQLQTAMKPGPKATAGPANPQRIPSSARTSTRQATTTGQSLSNTTKAATSAPMKPTVSVLHQAVLAAKSKVSLEATQSTSTTDEQQATDQQQTTQQTTVDQQATNGQDTSSFQTQSTGQTVSSQDTATAQFTGYVMTADKTPVVGATIDITNGTDTQTLTSGPDGMIQATLAVGKWQIGDVKDSNQNEMTVTSPAAFDVTTDSTVPPVEIIVAPADSATTQAVSGNVFGADETTPWPNTTFTVSDGTNAVTFTSNARGGFSGKLTPGTWTVTSINGAALADSSQTFTVQSGQDLTNAKVVDPNGDFMGGVTMDGSTPAAGGVLTVVDSQSNSKTAQLDSLGKFHLDLVPGTYQLTSLQYNGDTWFIGATADVTAGNVLSQSYQPRSVVMLGQPNTFITPNTDVNIPVDVTPSTQLDDGVAFKVSLTGSPSSVDLSMNINGQNVPLAFDDSGVALVGDPTDKATRFYLGPDSRLSINGKFAAAGDYGIQVTMLDSQGAELSSDTQTYTVHAPNVNGVIVNEEAFALTLSEITLNNGTDSVPVMTDNTGKFTTYLPDGTWSVAGVMDQHGNAVSLAQPVSFTVTGGQPDTQNINVVVSVPILTGTVMLDDSTPAANAEVYLFKMVSGSIDSYLDPIVVTTDANGKFSEEVAPGQYYVYEAMDESGDHLIGKYITVDSKMGAQTFTTQQISLAGPTEAGAGGVSMYEVVADSTFNQYDNIYYALDVKDSQGQTVTSGVKFQTFGNDNEEDFTFNQETGQWTACSSSPVHADSGLSPLYATFDTPGTYTLTYHVMDAKTHQSVASVTQELTVQTPNLTGTVYLADGKTYSPYSYLEFTNSSGGTMNLSTDDRGNFSAYLDPDTWTLTSVDGNTLGDGQQPTIDTSKLVSPMSISDPWEDFNGSVTVGGEPLPGWTLVAFDKYGNEQDVYLNDQGQFIADLPSGDYTAAYVYPDSFFGPIAKAQTQVLSGHTTTSSRVSGRTSRAAASASSAGLGQFMDTWMQRLRLGKLNVNNPSGVANTSSTSAAKSSTAAALSPKTSGSVARTTLSPAISSGAVGDLPFGAIVLNQPFSVQTGSLTTEHFEPPTVSLGFDNDVLEGTDVNLPAQIIALPDSQGYVTVNVQKGNVAATNSDVKLTNTDLDGTPSTLSLDSTGTVSIGSAQDPFTGSPALNLKASFASSGDYTVTVTYYGVDGNPVGSGSVVEHVHTADVHGKLISDPGPGLTGLPIPNAKVVISQGTSTWTATTDSDGNFDAYVPPSDMGYNIHQIYDWNGDEVDFQTPYVFDVQNDVKGDPVMMVGEQQKDSNGNVTGVVQTPVQSLTVATSKTTMLSGTADASGTLVIYPEATDDTGASTGLPDMSQQPYEVKVADDGTFSALLPQGDYYITSEKTSDGSLDVDLPVPASDQTRSIDVASALHMTIEAPSNIFPQVTGESYYNAIHIPASMDISKPVYFVLDVTLDGNTDTQDAQVGMHMGASRDHYDTFKVNQSNQLQLGDASNPETLTPTTEYGVGLNTSYTTPGKYVLTLHMYDTSNNELATATQTFNVKSPNITGIVKNQDGTAYGSDGTYIKFVNAADSGEYTWVYVWKGNFNMYLPAGDWTAQTDDDTPVPIVVTAPTASDTVHVGDPGTLQNLTFQLKPAQQVPTHKASGTVTLSDGKTPIPNAGIVLYQTNSDRTQTFGDPVFVYADENGVFSDDIPQGQYLITSLFTGDYKVAVDPMFVDASTQDVTGIAVTPEMQPVVGSVVAADRKTPLAGAQVHLVGPLGDVDSTWATTDANGQYSFTGEVGTWTIDEIKYAGSDDKLDDWEQFNPAISKEPVVVPRVVDPYADFGGQILDGSTPAAGWKLHVIQPDGTGADVTLDANGKFVLSESKDGDYILDSITNASGTVTRSIHKTAHVVKGKMASGTYSVVQNTLSGTVFAADGKTALPNAKVHLSGPAGEDVWLTADGTGKFSGNVAEGSWSIDKVTFASDTETLTTPVTFSSTANAPTITLANGVVDPYADLTGQVQLDDGSAAAGWTLSITGPSNFSKQVTLDASGSFILSLKDGTYTLTSISKNGTTRDIQTSVTVAHGTLKSQTFKVKPIVTGGGSGTGGSGSGTGGGGGTSTGGGSGSGTGTSTGGNTGGKVTYGTILVTQTVTSSGATFSQTVDNSSVTVDIPANAFQGAQQVELTTTDTQQLSAVVPSGSTAIVGFGVNFNGPTPTVPITLTIKNDSIPAGAQVYKVADDGTLVPVQATVTDGQAVITFSSDPNFVIVKEPVVTPKKDQRVLRFNGKVAVVPALVDGGTTYMPIWYVMQMLKSVGIDSTWDGHHWKLTTAGNPDLSKIHSGTGTMSIYLNDALVQKVFGKYAVDPSSGQKTTFMPIWYVMQILKRLNITSTWDGTTWTLVEGQ